MRKLLFVLLYIFFAFGFAQNEWEENILNQENKKLNNEIKIINEKFNLFKFETNEEFEQFIFDKFSKDLINYCKNYYIKPIYRLETEPRVKGDFVKKSLSFDKVNNSIIYGKTNIQKNGIDEPEILKTTRKYIIYANTYKRKIYILKSPVNGGQVYINKVEILDQINIPNIIFTNSIKLFFSNDILIIIGSRYSESFGQNVTDVIFYKIQNGKAKFLKFFDIKGYFEDARLLNNKLYIVSSYKFPLWKLCGNMLPIKSINPLNIDGKGDFQKKNILQKSLTEKLKKYFDVKNLQIIYTPGKFTKIKGKDYPITIKTYKSNINNILYLPSNLTGDYIRNFGFNIVNIIDIKDIKKAPNQYIIFGNMSNGVIHMTKNSLYLINSYYLSDYIKSYKCKSDLKCIMPILPEIIRGNYFTLIHKLKLNDYKLNYINSYIVPGKPINQYSMDEDKNGYFRIFTKSIYPNRKTDLFVFDENLNLVGKIVDIAPGEEFKSSRFIEDKVFLVTFKATDPLFVIDLKDSKNPKIIGELKIPGYSLYLHPYAIYDDVYYLIGIGQEAEIVNENWARPKNIKIDLYEIDFNKKEKDLNCEQYDFDSCPTRCYKNPCGSACKDKNQICIQMCIPRCENPKDVIKLNYISVKQLYSFVLGKEKKGGGGGSFTPLFENPRIFSIYTFKYNKNKKILFLPVYLVQDKQVENCYTSYSWENGKRIKIGEKCYTTIKKEPYFIGIKGILIDKDKGIGEVYSKNNISLYLQRCNDKMNCNFRWFLYDNLNPRVGYYSQNNNLYPFEINGLYFYISDFNKILEKVLKF